MSDDQDAVSGVLQRGTASSVEASLQGCVVDSTVKEDGEVHAFAQRSRGRLKRRDSTGADRCAQRSVRAPRQL